jgi:mono/diheme cytochrome c family protein
VKKTVAALILAATAAAAAADTKSAEWYNEYPHKDTPEAAIYRGNIVFKHYCVLCHGANADGKGRAARIYDPKPANLVLSDKNDDYKELIIRRGGAALARSQFMPPWDAELTNEQISDLLAFLRSIQANKP